MDDALRRSRWLVVTLGLIIIGCAGQAGSAPTLSAAANVAGLVQPGKLILATAGNFPPYTQTNPSTGKVEGYSLDIGAEVAKRLGLTLETPTVDFVAELQGLSSGKYDLADSGVNPTADRQKQFLFTVPVTTRGYVGLVLEKNKDKYKGGLQDVHGLNVGGVAGGIADQYFHDNQTSLGFASYTAFQGAAELLQALKIGRIDEEFTDSLQGAYYIKTHPGEVAIVGKPIFTSTTAFAMRQGNTGLQAAVNPVIKKMVTDGTLVKMQKKWWGVCIPVAPDINSTPDAYVAPGGC